MRKYDIKVCNLQYFSHYYITIISSQWYCRNLSACHWAICFMRFSALTSSLIQHYNCHFLDFFTHLMLHLIIPPPHYSSIHHHRSRHHHALYLIILLTTIIEAWHYHALPHHSPIHHHRSRHHHSLMMDAHKSETSVTFHIRYIFLWNISYYISSSYFYYNFFIYS